MCMSRRRVSLELSDEDLALIEVYRETLPVRPTRSAVIRRALRRGLKSLADGGGPGGLSHAGARPNVRLG